jgi:DNA-binding transcriptional ArsR family regulator
MEKQVAIDAFGALAQETRLDIFRLLVEAGPTGLAAGEIGEALGVPAATLSFHLKELRTAGMVASHRRGRSLIYAADFMVVDGLIAFLMRNCCQSSARSSQPSQPIGAQQQ